MSCTICHENNADTTFDGCCHTTCRSCIKQWLRKKDTCPYCRTKIKHYTTHARKTKTSRQLFFYCIENREEHHQEEEEEEKDDDEGGYSFEDYFGETDIVEEWLDG
jgi:hypothetical protein